MLQNDKAELQQKVISLKGKNKDLKDKLAQLNDSTHYLSQEQLKQNAQELSTIRKEMQVTREHFTQVFQQACRKEQVAKIKELSALLELKNVEFDRLYKGYDSLLDI